MALLGAICMRNHRLCIAQTIAAYLLKTVRRILIFNDFSSVSSPGTAVLDSTIASALEASPYRIELYSENIESTLFSDDAAQRRIQRVGTVKNMVCSHSGCDHHGWAFISEVHDRITQKSIHRARQSSF